MARPQLCPHVVYAVLVRCWADVPSSRPSFGDLVSFFADASSVAAGSGRRGSYERVFDGHSDQSDGQPPGHGRQRVDNESPYVKLIKARTTPTEWPVFFFSVAFVAPHTCTPHDGQTWGSACVCACGQANEISVTAIHHNLNGRRQGTVPAAASF